MKRKRSLKKKTGRARKKAEKVPVRPRLDVCMDCGKAVRPGKDAWIHELGTGGRLHLECYNRKEDKRRGG